MHLRKLLKQQGLLQGKDKAEQTNKHTHTAALCEKSITFPMGAKPDLSRKMLSAKLMNSCKNSESEKSAGVQYNKFRRSRTGRGNLDNGLRVVKGKKATGMR